MRWTHFWISIPFRVNYNTFSQKKTINYIYRTRSTPMALYLYLRRKTTGVEGRVLERREGKWVLVYQTFHRARVHVIRSCGEMVMRKLATQKRRARNRIYADANQA